MKLLLGILMVTVPIVGVIVWTEGWKGLLGFIAGVAGFGAFFGSLFYGTYLIISALAG